MMKILRTIFFQIIVYHLILYSNINKSFNLIEKESPFKKHLVVKEASYKDYLLLEKYHYFPSAEECISLSYNAKYYTLEYKGMIVGALIIRDPYSNEEENDSLLNINKKIKILYRIILHPLVRGCGILRLFLDNIYAIYSGKILYVESALARFIPIFESMGWVSLDESKFFYKKGLLLEGEDMNYLLGCLGDIIYNKYIDFCTIGNIEPSINKKEIIYSLKGEFNERDIDFVKKCLELYDMKRFIYEIK